VTETLNTTGFLITEIAGDWSVLTADFGAGYGVGALVGAREGTRAFSIRLEVLPDDLNLAPAVEGLSRERYLWQFYRTSKEGGDLPFWIELEDPADADRKMFLASFVDHALTYDVLCAKIYGTGLNLRQRRLLDTPSPVPVTGG